MAGVNWDNIGSPYVPSVNLVNGHDKLIENMSKSTALIDSVFKDKRSLEDKNYAQLQDSNANKLLAGLSSGELRMTDLNTMNLSNVNGKQLQAGINSILNRNEQHRMNTSSIARNIALINESKMSIEKDKLDISDIHSQDMGSQLGATIENAYSTLTNDQLKALQVGGDSIYDTLASITGINAKDIRKTLKGEELTKLRKRFSGLIERKIADPITKGTILKENAMRGDPDAIKEVTASDQQYVIGESQFIIDFYEEATRANPGKLDKAGQLGSMLGQIALAATTDSGQESQIRQAKYAIAQATEALGEEGLSIDKAESLNKSIIRAQDFIYVAEKMVNGEMGGSIDIVARNESRALKESLNQYDQTKEIEKLTKTRQTMATKAALDGKTKKKTPAEVAEEVTKSKVDASDKPDPIEELVEALIPNSKKKAEVKASVTTVLKDYKEQSNLKIPKDKIEEITSVAKNLLKKNSGMTPSRAVRRALHKLGLDKK